MGEKTQRGRYANEVKPGSWKQILLLSLISNNTIQAPRPWCRETGRIAMWNSYAITDHTSAHSEEQCSNSLLKASLAVASRFFCFSSDTEEVLYQNFKWLIFKETLVNGLLTARQCQWCLCSGASMLLSQRIGFAVSASGSYRMHCFCQVSQLSVQGRWSSPCQMLSYLFF